ncbi:helix-turn-helix transcriptional regulator [Adlercreutzia shanghongiae]|uniref:LuxR C-terminal-related transcriptional regulator n=1 Tax=Adlercreutzia shanghongiae TaxID=3111773 RepID=A0ABU6IYJ2_9ACTN|nr:LuxR C-terminal-related transcriptional regulator [Adlercreutzia sp. R22]MEC4294932.1 LuxR C-terminal-related transcriptional regulator [Adlercreutzia sp. R22]
MKDIHIIPSVALFACLKLSLILFYDFYLIAPLNSFDASASIFFHFVWQLITGGVAAVLALMPRFAEKVLHSAIVLRISSLLWVVGLVVSAIGVSISSLGLTVLSVISVSFGAVFARCFWILSLPAREDDLVRILVLGQLFSYVPLLLFMLLPLSMQLLPSTIFAVASVALMLKYRSIFKLSSMTQLKLSDMRESWSILIGVFVVSIIVTLLFGSSSGSYYQAITYFTAIASALILKVLYSAKGALFAPESTIRALMLVLSITVVLSWVTGAPDIIPAVVVWTSSSVITLLVFSLNGGFPAKKGSNVFVLLAFGVSILGYAAGGLIGFLLGSRESGPAFAVSLILVLVAFQVADTVRAKTERKNSFFEANNENRKRVERSMSRYDLTTAEQEVFLSLVRGNTLKRIAQERAVSLNTIKSQVASIYAKTNVHSKQELIDLSNELGVN